MRKKLAILLIIFISFTQFLKAQILEEFKSEGVVYKVELEAKGFSIPWGMDFLDKDRLIITQKNGKIVILNLKDKQRTSIDINIPGFLLNGQGGLMDVKVKDSWIYITYVKSKYGQGVTTLARSQLKANKLVNWQDLHVSKSATSTGRHFGSRIAFDEEGYIYYSIGDRGERSNGQDTSTHAGSIIRLHLDGSVPKDNPFVGKSGLDEIYSFGHRNPQGLFYDKKKQQLISNEHGPRGGDEINIIQKGLNYGWARVSYGKEYWGISDVGEAKSMRGMEDGIKIYVPSIAPSSLIVYQGDAFKDWSGSILSGALKLTHLNRIVLDDSGKVKKEERYLESLKERIRNVVQSSQGDLYLSTDSGHILKITPK